MRKRKVIIMTTTNYNVRLDQDLKDRAFSVIESYGLTPSQAIRLFLNQVADTNTVPLSFDYQPKLNALQDKTVPVRTPKTSKDI